MNESTEQNESTLFTVRIWRYDANQTQLRWRGKVQHVNTGAWRNFHNWDDLVVFLKGQLGACEPIATENECHTHISSE